MTYLAANASEPVYLELHKERVICRNCKASFMATSDVVGCKLIPETTFKRAYNE
ncbi:hypothetical protein IV86_GL000439 [Pediococcus pentosaceus]|nr:hypothetical protein IV86_GL000439 [Pediococcus pentosaceus]